MTADFTIHEVQRAGRPVGTVHRPRTAVDALGLLAENPEARPIAGGTDLLLDLQRGGPGAAVDLVDLTAIEGFTEITFELDHLRLAGGVRHNQIIKDERVVRSALPLAQACLEVGSPQLRNRATVAGNLATASPANDTISALMALGASVEISSLSNAEVETRHIAIEDFFIGFRQTVLRTGELITAIRVPALQPYQRGIWVKLGLRRAQAISVVHAGIVLDFARTISEEPAAQVEVTGARLSLGSVAPTVVLVPEFAEALIGRTLDASTIAEAASAATGAVTPITDGRATATYRTDSISVLIERSLKAIVDGEHASMWPDSPPTLSTVEQLSQTVAPPTDSLHPEAAMSVALNGVSHTAPHGGATLLDWVRDTAGATGMKEGCAEGECGACTMLVDGVAVMSCLVAAAQADGAEVATVEGLDHPIQGAFVDRFAVQCGFCIPGFLMAGARLVDELDDPTRDQIALGLSGNLCRCTGYYPIIDAVQSAAVEVRGRHV